VTVDEQPPTALSRIVGEIARGTDRPQSRAIASAIGRLIHGGSLPVDSRLPTVRALSEALSVSPTTVSEAWNTLAGVGAITAQGRRGTLVRRPSGPGTPLRYRQITEAPGHFDLDLSTGTPDPALLPDLGPVIARVSRQNLTSSYLDNPVLPELEDELVSSWPFQPEALTVVNGALDALDRTCETVLRLGDRVVVTHPAFPPMLDLLDHIGCEVIAVDLDEEGPAVDSMQSAMTTSPRAIILQPRAHNPTGTSMSQRRCDELASLLAASPGTMIIEDDHTNSIAISPLVSFGAVFPERTVHIRSFSKSHGPDLRLAALGGAGDVVRAVMNRRLLGPGWSSRILQALLLELLADPAMSDVLAHATATYARRRAVVAHVLREHGVDVGHGDGINLWVPVRNERAALIALASQGIGVAPGAPFLVRPDAEHIRVTVGLVTGDDRRVAEVAERLAAAATHEQLRTSRG